jgi:hypothetical protein
MFAQRSVPVWYQCVVGRLQVPLSKGNLKVADNQKTLWN